MRIPRPRMLDFMFYVLWGTCFLPSTALQAHSLRQKVGAYGDSQGLTRQRVGYDAKFETSKNQSLLSASNLTLGLQRDAFRDARMSDDNYMRSVYGQDLRVQNTVSLGTSQTWKRITETRVMGSRASDGVVSVSSWGAGASHWLRHETIRLSLDLSRTLVEQPLYQILDYDSQLVGSPPVYTATGGTVGLRVLASPTSIVETSGSYIANANRPATRTGSLMVRQFVPSLRAAVHASATRSLNRGSITTETNYGQVDAWIYDVAWLQNLWSGAMGRVGYRYYVEDETTRVREERITTGTDTVSLGFSQDLPQKLAGLPLTLELAAARFLTNSGVSATSGELGAMARF